MASFGVNIYRPSASEHGLSRILSILNLDWLQHARSVRGVYELLLINQSTQALSIMITYNIVWICSLLYIIASRGKARHYRGH